MADARSPARSKAYPSSTRLALCLAALLGACTSAAIKKPTVVPAAPAKLRRLYVVVDHTVVPNTYATFAERYGGPAWLMSHPIDATSESFSRSLIDALAPLLEQEGVDAKFRAVPPALDQSLDSAHVAAFAPAAILEVKAIECKIDWNAVGCDRLTYDVTVTASATQAPMWQASAANNGGTCCMGSRFRKMATRIVNRLKLDSVI